MICFCSNLFIANFHMEGSRKEYLAKNVINQRKWHIYVVNQYIKAEIINNYDTE